MRKHVAHLLIAYVEGQLSPRRAAFINRHVASCPYCREKLAAHERLATDLRLALGQGPTLHRTQIQQWWFAINVRPVASARKPLALTFLPVALSLLLLLIPLTIGRSSATVNPIPTPAVSSVASPVTDVTLGPVSGTGTTLTQPVSTPSAGPDMTIPAVPVPSAPPSP